MRNILVTGGSKGIGYALVKKLAGDPHNRVLAVARTKEKLDTLYKECKEAGGEVHVLSADLSLSRDREVLMGYLAEEFQSLDILVNNAGYLVNKPFEEQTEEDIGRQISINYILPFRLIQSCMPLMKKSKSAHVVNISSMGGYRGSVKFPGLSAYSSSKAALAVLTECLAEEYKETAMHFNCLALGAVQTEMLQKAFPGYRAPGSAEEAADFIADFAINSGRYFNGKVIPVSKTTP